MRVLAGHQFDHHWDEPNLLCAILKPLFWEPPDVGLGLYVFLHGDAPGEQRLVCLAAASGASSIMILTGQGRNLQGVSDGKK
jgi:hypothetical protein